MPIGVFASNQHKPSVCYEGSEQANDSPPDLASGANQPTALSGPRVMELEEDPAWGCRATLSIGNVLLLYGIPEGTIVCNVKHHVGDRGVFARTSRDYAVVISHNPNNGTWMGGAASQSMTPMVDGCL